jgi:hypothetical protein
VYKGKWRGATVAVKVCTDFQLAMMTADTIENIRQEVHTTRDTNNDHPPALESTHMCAVWRVIPGVLDGVAGQPPERNAPLSLPLVVPERTRLNAALRVFCVCVCVCVCVSNAACR